MEVSGRRQWRVSEQHPGVVITSRWKSHETVEVVPILRQILSDLNNIGIFPNPSPCTKLDEQAYTQRKPSSRLLPTCVLESLPP